MTASVGQKAEQMFGPHTVAVSGGSLPSSAFSNLSLIPSGDPEMLAAANAEVIAALEGIGGLTNISSNLAEGSVILRVDGQLVVEYTGEVETKDALGLTAAAKAKLQAMVRA